MKRMSRVLKGLVWLVVMLLGTGLAVVQAPAAAMAQDVNDPTLDTGDPAADLFGVQYFLSPRTLQITYYRLSYDNLAPTFGGQGTSVALTVTGTRSDGSTQTVSIHAAGDGAFSAPTGAVCLVEQDQAVGASRILLPNTAGGCIGHFQSAGVAVQVLHNGATDQAPDSGVGPAIPMQPLSGSSQVALYSGGHYWESASYADAPTPRYCAGGGSTPFCTTADYGNPGDTLLKADSYPFCHGAISATPSCTDVFAYFANPGLLAVRAQPGGGLHWYKDYAQPVVCCPGGWSRGNHITVDFSFGNVGDIPVSGDWNGDGARTIGLFRPSTGQWFLTNDPNFRNTPGSALTVISFGSPGDIPTVGDWGGGGDDTPAVFRAGRWFELRTLRSGGADTTFVFGQAGDQPVPGDWNRDAIATPGVYRSGRWLLTNNPAGGSAQASFHWGGAALRPYVEQPGL